MKTSQQNILKYLNLKSTYYLAKWEIAIDEQLVLTPLDTFVFESHLLQKPLHVGKAKQIYIKSPFSTMFQLHSIIILYFVQIFHIFALMILNCLL